MADAVAAGPDAATAAVLGRQEEGAMLGISRMSQIQDRLDHVVGVNNVVNLLRAQTSLVLG